MSKTRISKLKGFDNVIVGRDMANIFKEGHVYSVKELIGTIIINDLGEHALMNDQEGCSIADIIIDGRYCLTKEEYNCQ